MAKTYFIPYNVSDGQVSVAGQMVKRRNLIEGLCSGAAVFFLLYSLLPFKFNIKLAISFIISVFVAVLGLVGVNGDPVSIFIANWFRFVKHRRITYYNPRIKNETEPALLNIPKRDKSPLERMKLGKSKDKKRENERFSVATKPVSPQLFEDEFCMLLSDTAKSIALPMLLCTEDDVEGNHSTASGKADKKELRKQKKRAKARAKNSKKIKIITSEKVDEDINNDE